MTTDTLIYVEWNDSAATHGWITTEELQRLPGIAKCKTVGFLVRESDGEILLARDASVSEHTSPFGDIISIPIPCITKRETLCAYSQTN